MLTAAEFNTLLNATGVPVTWQQAKAPAAVKTIKAIDGTISKYNEALINTYGVGGKAIQVAASSIPVEPVKFDVFVSAVGERYVVDSVVVHKERNTGRVISFTCYCKGK